MERGRWLTDCGITIDWALGRRLDNKTHHCRDHGYAEADEAVDPEVVAKGGRIGRVEEDEIDVEGHGKGPPGVGLHEPSGDSC